jgi:transposase
MVACDLHDRSMLLKLAQGREPAEKVSLANTAAGRKRLLTLLGERSAALGGAEVIVAYEASSLGFGLYDLLVGAGFRCHVLAPNKISRPVGHARNKTDEKDADLILETLRGHVLAGNRLPAVWIPDRQTRDDRELVRARLDAASKIIGLKAQIKNFLKRHGLERPPGVGKGWTKAFHAWLRGLATGPSALGPGARQVLPSLLRQLKHLEEEGKLLEQQIVELAVSPRYVQAYYRVSSISGVGLLSAMTFLTEIGDPQRFANRRQVAAYFGLVPSAHESGERSDRKGHITRQGSGRMRRVLCQAVWSRLRYDEAAQEAYYRIARRNPKRRKVAVVAGMRRLVTQMWHRACDHPAPSRPAPREEKSPPRQMSPAKPAAQPPLGLSKRGPRPVHLAVASTGDGVTADATARRTGLKPRPR